MFELILKIINVILPIFILMGVGAFCFHRRIINENTNEQLKSLIFKVLMPTMLFFFMSQTDKEIIDFTYVLLVISFTSFLIGLAILINHKYFTKTNTETGVASLTWSFANSNFLGLPMAFLAFGEAGMPPAIIVTTIYTIIFIGSCIFLTSIDSLKNSQTTKIKFIIDLCKKVLLTPMIFAPLAGLMFALFNIPIPKPIYSSLELISNANIGLSLFVIGTSLYIVFFIDKKIKSENIYLELFATSTYKLIISPLIAFIIIYSFDMDIIWK